MIPGAIGKFRNRLRVYVFYLARHAVLFQEGGQPFVESGIVGVAIDFRPIDAESIQRTFQARQARKIFVQHLNIFAGTGAGANRHSGSFGRQFSEQSII